MRQMIWSILLLMFAQGTSLAGVCDVDGDNDIDQLDIDAIIASYRQHVPPGDPRDFNGDGIINSRDRRPCRQRCTLFRCAVVDGGVENRPPVADPGPNQAVFPGETATFDGTQSSDPDGDSLSFAWSLINAPGGSTATLNEETTSTPSLTPDVPGTYVLGLVVSDGALESNQVTVELNTRSVAYEFDLNQRQTAVIDETGGELSLTDANGRRYTIQVPEGSVVDPTEFSLTAVASVAGLPEGFDPIASIRMEPSGLTFNDPVILTFELPPGARSGLPSVGLFSNDNGEMLFLRTISGTNAVAARTEDLIVTMTIPHFSTASITEVSSDAEVPPPPPDATPEEIARHNIEQRAVELLEIDGALINDPIIFLEFLDWFQDIERQLNELAINPDLSDLSSLSELTIDAKVFILEAAELLDFDEIFAFEDAITEVLAETVASYLVGLKELCGQSTLETQGNLSFIQETIVEDFFIGDLESFFDSSDFQCQYFVQLTPAFQAEFAGGTVEINYVLTAQDGSTITNGFLQEGIDVSFSAEGMNLVSDAADTFTLQSTGQFGLSDFSVQIGSGPEATAQVLWVPNLAGSYGGSGSGSAAGCQDEEDDGPGSGSEGIEFVTQQLLSASPTQAVVGIAGVGTVVTEINLTVTLNSIGVNSASGTAFGGASYREVEVEDDETFITNGSGSLDGSVVATTNGNSFGLNFVGGDNFCSSVTGFALIQSL